MMDPFDTFPIGVVHDILEEIYKESPVHETASGWNKWATVGSARLVSKRWNDCVESHPFLWNKVWFSSGCLQLSKALMAKASAASSNICLSLPRKDSVVAMMRSLPKSQLEKIDCLVVKDSENDKDFRGRKKWTQQQNEELLVDFLLYLDSICHLKMIDLNRSQWCLKPLTRLLEGCSTLEQLYIKQFRAFPFEKWPQLPRSLKQLKIPTAMVNERHRDSFVCTDRDWIFNDGLEDLELSRCFWPAILLAPTVCLRLPGSLRCLNMAALLKTYLSASCGQLGNLRKLSFTSYTNVSILQQFVDYGMTNLKFLSGVSSIIGIVLVCRSNPKLEVLFMDTDDYVDIEHARIITDSCSFLKYLCIKNLAVRNISETAIEWFKRVPELDRHIDHELDYLHYVNGREYGRFSALDEDEQYRKYWLATR